MKHIVKFINTLVFIMGALSVSAALIYGFSTIGEPQSVWLVNKIAWLCNG